MTDEIVKIENCRVAMKAALEAIQDYCGMAPKTVRVGGVEFQLPEEIYEIATSEMPPGDQIDKIVSHPWTYQQAERICDELIKPKGENRKKCAEHMLHTIASAIVTGEELGDE